MTDFWTHDDERRLAELHAAYGALLARRPVDRMVRGEGRGPHVSAATLYKVRRIRDGCFPSPGLIFGEPCWDILLDLRSAGERGRSVSLSSACLAAQAPPTTGRRRLRLLERLGLVERRAHPLDGRAETVALTVDGVDRMDDFLGRLPL